MNKKYIKQLLIIIILLSSAQIILIQAYGQTCTGNQELVDGVCRQCYELGTCDFFEHPLDTMLEPFVAVFGGFFYIIIWGLIIGILWLRVSNTMVVAIIGVVLAVLLQSQFTSDTQVVGYVLVALAVAVALYQILVVRTHYPTN